MRRLLGFLAVIVAVAFGFASPAAADPPGPTDYRSEVVSIEPAVDVGVRFIGGDSFVELDARGHDVIVVGYRGEPYLWFRDDGGVYENRRSPSRTLNQDRFGDVELPDSADVDAEPDWEKVADGEVYAWHDHRTHWMNPERPPGAETGDQILEGVVPLLVDGAEVDVTVASFLLPAPNPLSWLGAGAIGLLIGCGVWWRARLGARGVVGGSVAVAVLLIGSVAFWSVPAETGPPMTLWLLPGIALVFVGVGLAAIRRSSQPLLTAALFGAAGAEMFMWSWTRRTALVRALVPSAVPSWLDRMVIAGAGAFGAALVAGALWDLVRMTRAARPSPTEPSRCG